nr:anthranilate phosphoribosyltransferase [Fusobacteriaceae bacterium]
PEEFGMKKYGINEIKGGEAKENAEILKDLLQDKLQGAKKEILLLNAGAALYVGKKAESLVEGIKLADELIKNGSAYKKLEELIQYTKDVAK